MRRAALPAIGILGVAGIAAADPWTVRMESGAEADSNVTRTEDRPIAAAVGRLGGRIDYRDALLGGTVAVEVSSLARMVASARNKDESVMLDVGELRWLHPIGGSSLAAGVHLTAADSFGVLVPIGARTYRNLIIVFALTGFWHGANWTFLVWGLYHGALLIIERSFHRDESPLERRQPVKKNNGARKREVKGEDCQHPEEAMLITKLCCPAHPDGADHENNLR